METDQAQSIGSLFTSLAAAENDEKQRKEVLDQLNTALGNFSRTDLGALIDQMPLEVLFDCLGAESSEQIETTCGILKNLMLASDPASNLQKYHEFLLQGFQHPIADVRALVIAQLQRCVESGDASVRTLCNDNQDLVICTIKQLANDDLGLAKVASQFLVKLASNDIGAQYLLGPAGLETIKQIIDSQTNEAIKFRVYETLAQIANISEKNLSEIEKRSMLVTPLSRLAFETDDPLGQLNALEILAILAETPHSLQALANSGIYSRVRNLGKDWKNNPLGGLLFPGILKFIGRVGSQQLPPDELTIMVIDSIINSDDDLAIITVGFEALCYIGSTQEGKLHLDKERHLNACLKKAQQILESGTAEYRCRILEGLSHLFGSDEQHTQCLPKWFALIFPQISVLFELVQLPFTDIRLKALNFLASIAHLEWAQKHYLRSPGVIEFLTDRNSEPDKNCVLEKFKIVQIIVDSATPTTAKILSPENLAKLKVHVKEGPFYSRVPDSQFQVAVEGSS